MNPGLLGTATAKAAEVDLDNHLVRMVMDLAQTLSFAADALGVAIPRL